MASNDELACVYSALILQDGDAPVTADKLQALLKSANVEVEPFWPGLFSKAVESLSLKDLVSNVGAGAGAPAPAAVESAAAAPAAEEKKEAKKEEEEEEEDDDMGFGLFD